MSLAPPRTADVLRLAWPAVASYVLNNAYRVNDQFWAQGLGGEAQAALGATFFVVIMNFSLLFLAGGGTLALVARATGAADPRARDSVTRHALLLAVAVGAVLSLVGVQLTPVLIDLLGLSGATGAFGREYLGTLYAVLIPLALVPAIDNVFIGRGDTKTPMRLLCLAIGINYFLNPILIYGAGAARAVPGAPGVELMAAAAEALGIEGRGIAGAAWATGISRSVTGLLGLALLRWRDGVSLVGAGRPKLVQVAAIARISAPVSASIATYAAVYWALLALVLSRLDVAVTGGLGVGFTVFEGISFPCYLGVSIASASLVGRALGAGDERAAWEVVRSARFVGRVLGVAMTAFFLAGARWLAPFFTEDAGVLRETVTYVGLLAFSQYWVAVETINEKVLLGAGHTRPILFVSSSGNLLRIPLAYLWAVHWGWGAAGVWWAINATTVLKAGLHWWVVQRGRWTRHAAASASRPAA